MAEETKIDCSEVENLSKDLIDFATKWYPKETKNFLKKEVDKANKKAKQIAKAEVGTSKGKKKNWIASKSYHKKFKTGKVFSNDDVFECKVYNSSRHSHLIEYGHKKVPRGKKGKSNRGGQSNGFTAGKHIFEKTKIQCETEFEKNAEDFIDSLLGNKIEKK